MKTGRKEKRAELHGEILDLSPEEYNVNLRKSSQIWVGEAANNWICEFKAMPRFSIQFYIKETWYRTMKLILLKPQFNLGYFNADVAILVPES